jgi:DNA-binding PadR family transcriptional regulator
MPDKNRESLMAHAGEFEILVLLTVQRLGGDAYGISIRNELEQETSRTLTLGTVYKTLMRLESKGYLLSHTSAPTSARGGRRKKLYEVSPAGLEVVRRSLTDMFRLARGLDLGVEGQ